MRTGGEYRLNLLGPFRLLAPSGARIAVPSKRGQALIAMLALSGSGERTRSWLQDRLWGSRAPEQGMASLRRELSNLRALVNQAGGGLIGTDFQRAWIDLTQVWVDVRMLGGGDLAAQGELLEGLDIAGADEFEDWLRGERGHIAERIGAGAGVSAGTVGASAEQPVRPPETPLPTADFARLPALAVLPFSNQTGAAAFDHVAEGLSEDLIDRMAALRWLPVIARSSSLQAGAAAGDARDAAARFDAHYAVEGRLRRADDDLALSVTLIDVASGTQLWSSRSSLPQASARALIDEILIGLVAALGARIEQQEQAVAVKRPAGDSGLHDLIWRGKWHLNRLTRADAAAARQYFAQALALDPTSAEAIIQVAWARFLDLWVARASDDDTRDARKLAQRAVIADGDDARGYMLIGMAEMWLRQPLRAKAMLDRAIALNPSLVMARIQLGTMHYLHGDAAAAIAHLTLALRLSPSDQNVFFTHGELAQACLMEGDNETALHHAETALLHRAGYWMPYVIRTNALVRLGRMAEAKAALRELRTVRPDFTSEFCDWTPFVDPSWNLAIKQGLNQADSQPD